MFGLESPFASPDPPGSLSVCCSSRRPLRCSRRHLVPPNPLGTPSRDTRPCSLGTLLGRVPLAGFRDVQGASNRRPLDSSSLGSPRIRDSARDLRVGSPGFSRRKPDHSKQLGFQPKHPAKPLGTCETTGDTSDGGGIMCARGTCPQGRLRQVSSAGWSEVRGVWVGMVSAG